MDQLVKEFVQCVHDNEWSVYEENGSYHISTACLTANLPLRTGILNFFTNEIQRIEPASIVCLSQGIDEGIVGLTTMISMKLQKPFYVYNLDEPLNPEVIRSNLSNCTLLLPYVSDEHSLFEDRQFIQNFGGYTKQVIVIINESKLLREKCDEYRIDLVEFTTISKIIQELEKMGSKRSQEIIHHLKDY